MQALMKIILLIFSMSLFAFGVKSQTWSDDVAQIFYEKCTKCHHQGGVAPFSLMQYNEASAMAAAIYDAVQQDIMPPWPPNNNYQQYVHSRALEPTQKTTVISWLLNGMQEGNSANTPPQPIYNSDAILGSGDLTLQIPNYASNATAQSDDYVCFSIPSNLAQDRIIKSVEIVPGNRAIVHHCLIYIDPSGASLTDTIGGNCASPSSPSATLVTGYTPGSSPMTLPSSGGLKLGMNMPANSTVVFTMHYPEGSYGMVDSTKVIFHFYPPGEANVRMVSAAPVIQNWSFSLPPEAITTVQGQYPASGGLSADVSVLSVFPPMHLIGETIKVFGIEANGDSIPFIDIPHWHFHWQDFYFFKHIQKAPIGTTLKAIGTFNNTSANIHNPNSPPITITPGLNTTNEMFLVYSHFMSYQNGDELFDIEELMDNETADLIELNQKNTGIKTYPNPFSENLMIELSAVKSGDQLSITVFSQEGSVVKTIMRNELYTGQTIQWDGTNNLGAPVSKGIYFISVNINGLNTSKMIMKN